MFNILGDEPPPHPQILNFMTPSIRSLQQICLISVGYIKSCKVSKTVINMNLYSYLLLNTPYPNKTILHVSPYMQYFSLNSKIIVGARLCRLRTYGLRRWPRIRWKECTSNIEINYRFFPPFFTPGLLWPMNLLRVNEIHVIWI